MDYIWIQIWLSLLSSDPNLRSAYADHFFQLLFPVAMAHLWHQIFFCQNSFASDVAEVDQSNNAVFDDSPKLV